MKEKLRDMLDSAKTLLVAGTLVAGSIFLSEVSGITKAYSDYKNISARVFYEAHKKAPWLVWGDYGNPNINKERKLSQYRVQADIEAGLTGLIAGGMGLGIALNALEKRKREIKG
jgi:hypothetical protein